jgi:hypothetical protein
VFHAKGAPSPPAVSMPRCGKTVSFCIKTRRILQRRHTFDAVHP